MYLSYTGRKNYLSCPRKYWFRYVKKQKVADDPRKSMFGLVIGKVFEWFYNKKIWIHSNPESECLSLIDSAIDEVCCMKEFVKSSDPSFIKELRDDANKYVPLSIQVIRDHKLLSVNSRSEVDLTVDCYSKQCDMSLRIGGRADFVHTSENVWIVDGKGSVYREKYVDSEQLIWYAVQHYLKYHIAPTRLGFLYYKFPDDPVQWIVYNEQSMRQNLAKTFDVATKIRDSVFDATPSGGCHQCEFRPMCSDGIKHLASKRAENRLQTTIFDIEAVK